MLKFLWRWRFRTARQIHRNIAKDAMECLCLLKQIQSNLKVNKE